jgi:hypothetical protein
MMISEPPINIMKPHVQVIRVVIVVVIYYQFETRQSHLEMQFLTCVRWCPCGGQDYLLPYA